MISTYAKEYQDEDLSELIDKEFEKRKAYQKIK